MGYIKKSIKRIDPEILVRLKEIPTTIASDVQNRGNTMSAFIRPLINNPRICGQAITVEEMVGCNIMSHQALYIAEPGDVLIISARGHIDTSVWGGIQTKVAKDRGLQGIIVDGSVRDLDDIRNLNFPVYCKGVVPAGPHKGFAGKINVPISCGNVIVNPGDIIIADSDGVVVISFENVEEVYEKSLRKIEEENKWLEKINAGMTTVEAIGLDKYIKEMEIIIDE